MRYLILMLRRNVLCPLLVLALSGCNLLSGRCTYELRDLEAGGTITENGAELVSALITLSEERGSLNSTSMYWLLTGTTLKGHVLTASLRNASDLSIVRVDLPLASADRPEISQGAVDTRTGANLGGMRDLLEGGGGVIQLETDMPSRPTITFPLAPTRSGDWVRPFCS